MSKSKFFPIFTSLIVSLNSKANSVLILLLVTSKALIKLLPDSIDKANISSTIQFAGICTLKDDRINAYFREMENPQHNAWEPERHTSDSKTKAKANLSINITNSPS